MTAGQRTVLRVTAVVGAAALAGMAGIVAAHVYGASDPAAERYGANWPGDLESSLRRMTTEAAALWLLLRPWAWRPATALPVAAAVLTPWTMLMIITGMHGGPIRAAHDVWLALVWLGLVVGSVAVGVAATRRRLAHRP